MRLASSLILLLPALAAAQTQQEPRGLSSPIVMLVVLGALSLAPFILITMTSFVKISAVLSILRNALGTQQVPPNQVITGLAFILSIFIMTPVAQEIYASIGEVPETNSLISETNIRVLYEAAKRGQEPLRNFLIKQCHDRDRLLFLELAKRMTKGDSSFIHPGSFRVIIPAFVTSELKEAFQIGFLIFVPFLIIDLIVSNILTSMGMTMLSPVTISLPFKLLIFVLVDGWYLLVKGLVLSYI
ncbi:MAG: type III secretion system export apparatus subunit SctR [Acidobacteriota bacterium]|nr:type III secretion system export apparatus subunit SctR [Blastocatellia bacterium]MDW8411876.1 type III secretion system export apparatus subunit SctR [Acidobacteriota bacterium]